MPCLLLDYYNVRFSSSHARAHARVRRIFIGAASACPFTVCMAAVYAGREFVRCPEVRDCPYLGGRIVLCYDRLEAGSLSVLRRLSASRSVRYRRFRCISLVANTENPQLKRPAVFDNGYFSMSSLPDCIIIGVDV